MKRTKHMKVTIYDHVITFKENKGKEGSLEVNMDENYPIDVVAGDTIMVSHTTHIPFREVLFAFLTGKTLEIPSNTKRMEDITHEIKQSEHYL